MEAHRSARRAANGQGSEERRAWDRSERSDDGPFGHGGHGDAFGHGGHGGHGDAFGQGGHGGHGGRSDPPPWQDPTGPWAETTQLLTRLLQELAAAGVGRVATGPHRGSPAPSECRICPVCAGLRAVGDARPEVVAHLTDAARHLTLAAKAVVDAQADALGPDDRLHRIPLDEDD